MGKSLLFESIILTTGHQLLSSSSSGSGDAGVGRFSCGSKNAVVFHDINIATLVGADVEKVLCIILSPQKTPSPHLPPPEKMTKYLILFFTLTGQVSRSK